MSKNPFHSRRRALQAGVSSLAALAAPAVVAQHSPPGAAASSAPAAVPAHLSAQPSAPFATQPWGSTQRVDAGTYSVERVLYKSGGADVVGNLFVPAGSRQWPAVAAIGPVAFVKEQAPMQYATRLAQAGFVVLVFDPRFHGESAGEPRRDESREAKVADLRSALAYLAGRREVDPRRMALLGICQGVNWAVDATLEDERARAVALVAGHYLVPDTARLYLGSDRNVEDRIARATSARENWQRTGAVEYIPIVSLSDPQALLTAKPIHDFYYHWADRGPFAGHRGLWENRITRMSEAVIWGHRVDASMRRLDKPMLMVHSDRAASGPQIPRSLFEQVASRDKQQAWLDGRNQIQFYQDPMTLDAVTARLAGFFQEKLT